MRWAGVRLATLLDEAHVHPSAAAVQFRSFDGVYTESLTLAQAKEQTGSNKGLFDTVGDGVTLAGVPVLVSTDVAAGNAWGVDSSQVFVVQRTGTTVVKSSEAAFDYDAVQVRATARVSWGFANPAGVVRLYDAA